MSSLPVSMLDVPFTSLRLPYQVPYTPPSQHDQPMSLQLAVVDAGNTYIKVGSMTRAGMVAACESSAVSPIQDIIYGHQTALTVINVGQPSLPAENFIVGEDALASPTNLARIGTLQERFNASPQVLRAQIFNGLFKTFMQKTSTSRYSASILLALEIPLEDYQKRNESTLIEGIAELLKGEWRIENSRGVLSLNIVGIVPLPQTYGMIVAYCTDPTGRIIQERAATRFAALDIGGGQIHLGRAVGTRQFAGQLVGRGVAQTAENLISLAAKRGIRMTFHQAVHALHTNKAPDGGAWVEISDIVAQAKDLSSLIQVAEAVNVFTGALQQARGLIGGGSAIHYGNDIVAQLADEYQGKAEVINQAQYANMLGGYALLLSFVARNQK